MRNFSQRRNPRTPKTQKMAEEEVRTESENSESSSSDDPKTPENKTTEYEKQRELVIARNKARMESMGLQKIANSLMNLGHTEGKKRKSQHKSIKSKKDDEYEPDNDDEEQKDDSSEATLDNSSEEFEQEKKKKKITNARNSKSHSKKVMNRKLRSGKQVSLQKFPDITDLMSEDEALKQAMALSLKDLRDTSFVQQHDGLSQGSNELAASSNGKGCDRSQKDDTRRKKKSFKSRMQMTEDDLVVNFCQFDEVGKGSITLRDVQRMAASHDFTWTDKELADMIRCFDSNRDGKLTLDDFRNIVVRCNILQVPEYS